KRVAIRPEARDDSSTLNRLTSLNGLNRQRHVFKYFKEFNPFKLQWRLKAFAYPLRCNEYFSRKTEKPPSFGAIRGFFPEPSTESKATMKRLASLMSSTLEKPGLPMASPAPNRRSEFAFSLGKKKPSTRAFSPAGCAGPCRCGRKSSPTHPKLNDTRT